MWRKRLMTGVSGLFRVESDEERRNSINMVVYVVRFACTENYCTVLFTVLLLYRKEGKKQSFFVFCCCSGRNPCPDMLPSPDSSLEDPLEISGVGTRD